MLTLDESANEDDEVTEIRGISFLISKKDAPTFGGAKVDLTKTEYGEEQFAVVRE